jgi:hypothetical protein
MIKFEGPYSLPPLFLVTIKTSIHRPVPAKPIYLNDWKLVLIIRFRVMGRDEL